MSTEANPYASPGGDARTDLPSRPKSPKVIGILSLVFGVLGLLSGLWTVFLLSSEEFLEAGVFDATTMYSPGYMATMTGIGFISSSLLIAAGIGLVKYRKWGRTVFLVYAAIAILLSVGNAIYVLTVAIPNAGNLQPTIAMGMQIGAIGGAISGSLFPVISVVFLCLRRVVDSLH